jgi:hypothetical protein
VCAQDPRNTLFIRYDGCVAPCINLALGGPSSFLSDEVTLPTVHYGRLPHEDLLSIWDSETCRIYRDRFASRVETYDRKIASVHFGPSLLKLKETFEKARKAMPEAPPGCRQCHYLYDI